MSTSTLTSRTVLTKATLRAATALGLDHQELAQVLGKHPAIIYQMAGNSYRLDRHGKEWERAVLLVRLYAALSALLLGDPIAARTWMRSSNTVLRAAPRERIRTVTGLVDTVGFVEASLERI